MYICYAYLAPAPLCAPHMRIDKPQPWTRMMTRSGTLYFLSTREQIFEGYEIYYNDVENVAVTIPSPQCVYVGLVREVFPKLRHWHQLVAMATSVMEIWAGSNMTENAIDLYHRMVYLGVESRNVWAHYIVQGAGNDPVNWYYGQNMKPGPNHGRYIAEGTTLVIRSRQ